MVEIIGKEKTAETTRFETTGMEIEIIRVKVKKDKERITYLKKIKNRYPEDNGFLFQENDII